MNQTLDDWESVENQRVAYVLDKIVKALEKNADMSYEELGDVTGLSRATIGKYIPMLQKDGKVEVKRRGPLKLVKLLDKRK